MLEWIISSAVLLAAVIAVRYALRGRLRPGVQYAMWAIVLVRLLVPVSFGSGAAAPGPPLRRWSRRLRCRRC